ncbi:hypothetical protein BJV78DRAFT_1185758 [Lactifluus subvellereus]|nr:hypothetical protein BJV78DRAFT_1185758 [Lactifluus subvellereus]
MGLGWKHRNGTHAEMLINLWSPPRGATKIVAGLPQPQRRHKPQFTVHSLLFSVNRAVTLTGGARILLFPDTHLPHPLHPTWQPQSQSPFTGAARTAQTHFAGRGFHEPDKVYNMINDGKAVSTLRGLELTCGVELLRILPVSPSPCTPNPIRVYDRRESLLMTLDDHTLGFP